MNTTIFKSKLLQSFSVYIGSTVLNSAIPFFLLPVFTKYLTPEDYGYVSLFTVVNSFLLPLIGFSSIGSVSREYFNQKEINFSKILGNTIILYLFSIPLLLITLLILSQFSNSFGIPKIILFYGFTFSIFAFLTNAFLAVWQASSKSKGYGLFQISNTLLNATLSLLLVVAFLKGYKGRIIAQVITSLIFGFIAILLIHKFHKIQLVYDIKYIKKILRFSLPLIPHSLGAVIISLSDRLFISKMVGLEMTGLYSIGFTIGSIIGFIEHSFNMAYMPWLFENLNKNNLKIKLKIVKITYAYFLLILLLALFLWLLSPFLFTLIDSAYAEGQKFVFWIALSFAFSGMYKMVTNYLFFVNKTGILASITFTCAILNMILNYFLIKYVGAIGAAISAAIVSFIFFITTWIYSSSKYEMPWGLTKK